MVVRTRTSFKLAVSPAACLLVSHRAPVATTTRPTHVTLLQVWDIGGQSISSQMLSTYVRVCQGRQMGRDVVLLCAHTGSAGLRTVLGLCPHSCSGCPTRVCASAGCGWD